MTYEYILALGSNQGHKLGHLSEAVKRLEQILQNMRQSVALQTAAILPEGAPSGWDIPYLNMVVVGNSTLEPLQLLDAIKQIEYDMGRRDAHRWAPRVIDIDILLWSGDKITDERLTIPHQELYNRPFLNSLIASLQLGPKQWQQKNLYPDPARAYAIYPKIVGIVNLTPDSFSDGGRYSDISAVIQQINKHIENGASVIELGAQSTRPGAEQIGWKAEFARLEPVLQALKYDALLASIPLSIDTYHPEIVLRVRDMGITNPLWINDVTGLADHEMVSVLADIDCKIVVMHALGVPPDPADVLASTAEPMEQLLLWASKVLEMASRHGIGHERIILDPGIGFGKSPYQSIAILREVYRLKSFGCQLLVGHSRKSFMRAFSAHPPIERDLETVALSIMLAQQGVNYLRVHNVEANMRALVALAIMDEQCGHTPLI